jgi:hypothetical protein
VRVGRRLRSGAALRARRAGRHLPGERHRRRRRDLHGERRLPGRPGLHRGGECDRASDAFPPFDGVTCAPDESPFRAFFELPRPGQRLADFYRLPFPNDLRVRADGTLDLSDFPRPGLTVLGVDLVDLYADAAEADFGGFASIDGGVVPVLVAARLLVGGRTAPRCSSSTSPRRARRLRRQPRPRVRLRPGRGKFACQNRLTLGNRTTDPLEPGHTYAAWISTAVRSTTGAVPSKTRSDRDARRDRADRSDAAPAAWAALRELPRYLAAENRCRHRGRRAVFTVADAPARWPRSSRPRSRRAPAPVITDLTLCDGVAISPCATAGDTARACGDSSGAFWELHGRLAIPNYQAGTLPYERPADGGAIAVDGSGEPIAQGDLAVCFALTCPRPRCRRAAGRWWCTATAPAAATAARSTPDRGELATASVPMATFTLDGVGHGERRGTSTRTPDSLVFNIVNPRAARDNHLQGAVDVMTALRLGDVAALTVPTVGTVQFDPTRTYYFGHSQGANVGIPAVAVSPRAPGGDPVGRRLGAGRGHPRQEAPGRRARRASSS